MRLRLLCALLIVAGLSGCGNSPATTATIAPAVTKHTYNGTASVGDFLTITIDKSAMTITYTNFTNGQHGTIPYTVNLDGSYALADPNGNLIAAEEIPGYALLIQAAHAGPNQDTQALITAVESGPTSMSTFANNSYNYMQFRTAAGGLEIGSISIGTNSAQHTSYWPYGNFASGSDDAFGGGTFDLSAMQEDPSGTYLSGTIAGAGSGINYVFGTASGFFIVDTPNGSILGLQKAATPNFNPSVAGNYNAIYYKKINASTGAGNVETGTPSLGNATIAITATGGVTITTAQGIDAQGTLTPVSSASYLYGPGELTDPCNGLFTFHVTNSGYQQDVFVSFINNAVVFSSFQGNLSGGTPNGTYNYEYGVGLQ
jgi:hypothetical protein